MARKTFNAKKYAKEIEKSSFEYVLGLYQLLSETRALLNAAYTECAVEEARDITPIINRVDQKIEIVYGFLLNRANHAEKTKA